MVRKGYIPEQIIGKLREAEVLLSQGATVGEASKKIGVTEQTYYRWRKAYGGMRVEQARRLKELERLVEELRHCSSLEERGTKLRETANRMGGSEGELILALHDETRRERARSNKSG